jgi:glycosyltransferase involved in cell wall biosynthesis
MPAVAVVMPAHNSGRFIEAAIGSVLNQEFNDWELLVVDDGSVDGTREIVSGFADRRITILSTSERRGPSVARNLGVDSARSEWIYFLDADDRTRPGALTRLVSEAVKNPRAVVVYGVCARIDEAGRQLRTSSLARIYKRPSGDVLRDFLEANFIAQGTAIVRKSSVDAVGGWDPNLLCGEDMAFWPLVAATGPFRFVRGLIALDYRQTVGSLSELQCRQLADYEKAIEAPLTHPLVIRRYSSQRLASIKRRRRAHIAAHIAVNLVRCGGYREAAKMLASSVREAPGYAPTAAAKVALAAAGRLL